jgi:uroporphyrinogen decarboxylase
MWWMKSSKPVRQNIPLIGFCGAPLTVLLFMLQGLGRKGDFPDAVKFIYQHPEITKKLVDAITELSIVYAKEQIKHGVEVFQLLTPMPDCCPSTFIKNCFFRLRKKWRLRCGKKTFRSSFSRKDWEPELRH